MKRMLVGLTPRCSSNEAEDRFASNFEINDNEGKAWHAFISILGAGTIVKTDSVD